MNEDERDLAALRALGALPREEAERVDRAAASDPELAAEVERYRDTVQRLEADIPRVPLPDGVLERILERVEAPELDLPEPRRVRRHARRWAPVAAAAAVAAGIAVALTMALSGGSGLGDPAARAAIAGTAPAQVRGEALLFAPDRPDGTLVLELDDVPPAPAGHHYEVWVLRDSSGGAMEAVGAFAAGGENVRLELPLPGAGDYAAVDISIQEDGGPAEHSGVSLAGGAFALS